MARNIITVDVEARSGGSFDRVGLEARRAGGGLNQAAEGAAQADRNIKGAANASSNATKNFSKMSQGMGGLVAAYATVAAQVFALSAAYQFLLNAADFRILLEGQKALTATTGLAYTSITKSIQKATNAQLAYQEAAQSAAISTAAGLGADQVTRLAELADTISKTLGRDLTDTFNRLVRGITKAEPELLDELGIVLRLKDATEEYALSVGKSASSLTSYERTQAVFLNTVGQGEEKFGALGDTLDGSSNKIRQLGVALGEVANKLKPVISAVSEFAAGALTENLAATITTFGLLAGGVLKQLLPSIREVEENYAAAADRMAEKQTRFNKSLEETRASQRVLSRMAGREAQGAQAAIGDINAETRAARAAQGIQTPISKTMQKLATGQLDPNSAAFKKFRASVDKELKLLEQSNATTVTRMRTQFVGMTRAQLLAMQNATTLMMGQQTRLEINQQRLINAGTIGYTRLRLAINGVAAALSTGARAAATFGMALLSFLGWVGLAITLGTLLYQGIVAIYNYLNKPVKTDGLTPLSERLTSLSDETKTLVQDFEKMQEKADSFNIKGVSGQIEFFGNAATSLPIDSLISSLGKLDAKQRFFTSTLLETSSVEREVAANRQKAQSNLEDATNSSIASLEKYRKKQEELKALESFSEKEANAIANLTTETYASLAAFAKLDPRLKEQAAILSDAAVESNKLSEQFKEGKKDVFALSAGLSRLARDTKSATTEVIAAAQKWRDASAAFSSLQQSIKTYNDRIRGSINLTEIQQSYLELSNIAKNYNDTVAALPTNVNIKTYQQLEQVKNAYKEVIKVVKDLYERQKLLSKEKIQLNINEKQLGLIQGSSEELIRLRAKQERAAIALRKREEELEIERLNSKLKELRAAGLNIKPEALATPIGESITEAGKTQAELVGEAIESSADYHARAIAEAMTGKSLKDLGEENAVFADVLKRIGARQQPNQPVPEDEITDVPIPFRPLIMPKAGLQGAFEGAAIDSAALFVDALDTEIKNKGLSLKLFDNETLKSQVNEVFDIYKQKIENATRESEQRLAPLREIASTAEGSERVRQQLYIAEQEKVLSERTVELTRERNAEVFKLLSAQGNLQSVQQAILDIETNTLELADEAKQKALDKLRYEEQLLLIAEKYNKLNQERQIQEKFLSLSAGSYADAARESLAVASATNETNQIAEEINARKLRMLDLTSALEMEADGKKQQQLLKEIQAEQSLLEKNAESYALSKASLEVLKEQVSVVYKIGEAAKSALGEGLTQEFANFLKGGLVDVEKSFLTILQGVGNAVADQMAKMLSDSAMNILGMGPISEEQKALERAKVIAEAQAKIHTDALIPVFEAHANSIRGALPAGAISGVPLVDANAVPPGFTLEGGLAGTAQPEAGPKTLSKKFQGLGDDLRNWSKNVKETFAKEDTPFLDKLGSIFNPEADWLKGMVGGLTGVLGAFAMSKLGGGDPGSWRNAIVGGIISAATAGFGGFMQGVGTSFFAANGAVFPGGFRSYANGGMVKEPTLGLVGEGKYNEAIVPLPDGRSIPVIMQGAGGDRTTVGINVNVNSSGQAQTNSQGQGDRGVAMAQALSAVVQQEIKRQKRPGGLLSPY
jgi:hypothetical protein